MFRSSSLDSTKLQFGYFLILYILHTLSINGTNMSNISDEHKGKLQILLYSTDFESMVQGLELLDILSEDENDIYFVFDVHTHVPSTVQDLEIALSNVEYKCYLIVWILGKLIEMNVSWVLELRRLDLQSMFLQNIPEVIGNLKNLTRLNLSENQLTILPDSIGNLTMLTELDINDNRLTILPDSIGDLTSIQTLNLTKNRLTNLPNTLANLYKNIQINDLEIISDINIFVDDRLLHKLAYIKIDGYCKNFRNITEINLSEYRLTRLPPSIGNLTNLTYINLSKNRITMIPQTIGNLTKLKTLDLSRNYRQFSLPNTIGNLTNLTFLNLSTNKMTTLPETIGNLTNLKRLYLYANKLSSVPRSICELVNIIELDLYSNKLTVLPMDIGKLRNIKNMSLYFNSFSDEEKRRLTNIFGDLVKL
jgi:Leucine-rich repeat (LRR) protein